jgi:hypothetical protein
MAKNQALRTISSRQAKAENARGAGPAGVKVPAFRLPRDADGTVELADFAGRALALL